MKEFFDKKLSKKTSIICIVCIALFVLAGMIGAIVGHRIYLNSREAFITNYSTKEGATLRMRNNGCLVYSYQDALTELEVTDVLEISDGATIKAMRLETIDGTVLPLSTKLDLTATPHVFLFLHVTSEGNQHQKDYILEVVSASDYQADQKLPPVLFDDGPVIQ